VTDFKIGVVTHYFDRIGVAVVDLVGDLASGEKIRLGSPGFTQTVSSIQIEHEKVESAKKGQSIGLKVDQPTQKGDEVFRLGDV